MKKPINLIRNSIQNDSKINVFCIQTDQLMQLAIEEILTNNSDFQLVGQTSDGIEGIKQVISLKPDLLILDIDLSNTDGICAIQTIKKSLPQVKILIFTNNRNENTILAAMGNEVNGYCLKEISIQQLLAAIITTSNGGVYLDSQIAHFVTNKLKPITPKVNLDALSTRESEVLKLVVKGKTNKEIGEELFLSPNTVKTHIRAIMNKLLVDDRVQIAVEALRSGLI